MHGARRSKKSHRHLRGGAEVRFAFIEQHAAVYPVRLMCRVLEVSPSGYYASRSRPESPRIAANRQLVAEIRRIEARHQGRYGSPRMHAALRAHGHRCSRGRVERLMRRHRIRALAGRRYRPCTTDSRHHLAIAPNLLAQRFEAPAPNRVWLADITYIATGEGWLYLAAVLDVATRKIVGWAMRDHMRTELALSALMMAVQRQRPGRGLDPPLRQGQPIRGRGLCRATRCGRCRAVHEPHRQLLRQCTHGKLLPHAEGRARPPASLGHPRRGPTRPVRLHRRLLQSRPHPLRPRVSHPRAGEQKAT